MWLEKAASVMERGLAPLTTIVGRIGAGFIALMMLMTVADIIGRKSFNQPVVGAYELSELMLVVVAFFSMANCEFIGGHVTIGVLVSRLRQKPQTIIDSLMYFLFLVISCLLTWRLFVYAMAEVGGQITNVLELPIYPAIFAAAFGCALFSLVIVMRLFIFLDGALKK